jgi:hypothetical protein
MVEQGKAKEPLIGEEDTDRQIKVDYKIESIIGK